MKLDHFAQLAHHPVEVLLLLHCHGRSWMLGRRIDGLGGQ
jgi:hypothetical protein